MDAPSTRGLKGVFTGVRAVFAGLGRIVSEPRLRRLALLPILLTLLLYGAVIAGAVLWVDDLVRYFVPQPASGELRLGWYVLLALAYVATGLGLLVLFLSAVNLIAGPFYDTIAESILDEQGAPKDPLPLPRAILVELMWSLTIAPLALVLSVLAFLPLVGIGFAILNAALIGLALATSAIAPALSATGHAYRQRWRMWRAAPALMIGIALPMSLSALVPVLGLIILPSGVVGATEALARAGLLVKR